MSNQLRFILLIIFVALVCGYTYWFYSTWHGVPPAENISPDQKKAALRMDHAELEALIRLNKTV